jgi:hypothetical protein
VTPRIRADSCNAATAGQRFSKNLLPLAVELRRENADPRRVAAGPRERGDELASQQVIGDRHDRYGRGGALRRANGDVPAGLDDIGATSDKGECQLLHGRLGYAEAPRLDHQVGTFDKTPTTQLVEEHGEMRLAAWRQSEKCQTVDPAGLLRPSRARQQRENGACGGAKNSAARGSMPN